MSDNDAWIFNIAHPVPLAVIKPELAFYGARAFGAVFGFKQIAIEVSFQVNNAKSCYVSPSTSYESISPGKNLLNGNRKQQFTVAEIETFKIQY